MKIKRDKVMEQYRKNFYNIYHRRILPILSRHEERRKVQLRLAVCVAIITASIVLPLYTFTITQKIETLYDLMMRVILFITSLGGVIIYFIRKDFIESLKASCMEDIAESFENLKWHPKTNVIDRYELQNSELFDKYRTRVTDDAFRGKYKGVNFAICETCLYKNDTDNELKLFEVIFKGVVIKFDFNKTINSKTFVASKGIYDGIKINIRLYLLICFIAVLFPPVDVPILSLEHIQFLIITLVVCTLFLTRFSKPLYKNSTKLIKLKDPEFNKHYRAYSTDQVEGRYLITPAFIERFKHIRTAFGGRNIKCTFYDNSILFAISTNKNLFEIGGLFHSLKDPKQMNHFFYELASIMSLIDHFKLTEHTGL